MKESLVIDGAVDEERISEEAIRGVFSRILESAIEEIAREDDNQLHITSRVVNADGFLIRSDRFETEPDIQSLFKVSERIGSALINRVRPEKSSIRKLKIRKASYKLRSSGNGGSDRITLSSRR